MVDPCSVTMAGSPSLSGGGGGSGGGEKKHWWLTNRKMVEKYVREAKLLMGSHEEGEIASALSLLDAALALCPSHEQALELKARCLLYLRRFKDVADMLHDYIPSLRMSSCSSSSSSDDTSSTTTTSSSWDNSLLCKERVKLLSSAAGSGGGDNEAGFKCFSVSDLKKKVMAGLCKNCDKQGHWRYLVLGQACCHLGLMEDAMVLLQTGKRLATAELRRESTSLSEDRFSFSRFPPLSSASLNNTTTNNNHQHHHHSPAESISHLISHIKMLLRRKTAAMAALDAGLYSESIRHFSKIVDGRRGAPKGFLAECYLHRASGYRSSGRIAEAIADCNRTLALDPCCIEALETRAALFETLRCLPDSLHDLEHLKLLYNAMLRDRKLPGRPVWRRQNTRYREIPGKLCSLGAKIQQLKQRVASGETGNVDYYALFGLRRGCTRSELERAHLLLMLRHKPDKSCSFIERCEFADETDDSCAADSVKDRAKMSALLLYRLIQRGHSSLVSTISEEEESERQRKKVAAALQAAAASASVAVAVAAQPIQVQQLQQQQNNKGKAAASASAAANPPRASPAQLDCIEKNGASPDIRTGVGEAAAGGSVYQGVFCRDLAIVGSLLSQVGFNRPLPVKYEALSC